MRGVSSPVSWLSVVGQSWVVWWSVWNQLAVFGRCSCLLRHLFSIGRVFSSLRAHLDQVLDTVVFPGFTGLNSEGARLNR